MGFNCLKAAEPLKRDSSVLQLSSQKLLVLIWSTSERRGAESTLEPLNGFEYGIPKLRIQHLNQPLVEFSKIKEWKHVDEEVLILNTDDDNNMNNLQVKVNGLEN